MNSKFKRIDSKELTNKLLQGETFGFLIGIEFSNLTIKLSEQVAGKHDDQVFLPYEPELFLSYGFRKYPVYCHVKNGQFEKAETL